MSTKPCLEAQQKARARPGLIGGYVPQCDEHGEYKPLQSHGSTGHSWCVDRMGFEISGSRAPPGRPTPTCYVVEPTGILFHFFIFDSLLRQISTLQKNVNIPLDKRYLLIHTCLLFAQCTFFLKKNLNTSKAYNMLLYLCSTIVWRKE